MRAFLQKGISHANVVLHSLDSEDTRSAMFWHGFRLACDDALNFLEKQSGDQEVFPDVPDQ